MIPQDDREKLAAELQDVADALYHAVIEEDEMHAANWVSCLSTRLCKLYEQHSAPTMADETRRNVALVWSRPEQPEQHA